MKKDIEWLKREIDELPVNFFGFSMLKQREEFAVNKDDVMELIDQLDEPEVLSDKWIDEHKVARVNDLRKMTMSDVVPVESLQNLLVPKQELPAIPKFVADWIEEVKPDNSLRVAFEYIAQQKRDNYDDELAFWVEEGNSETFARAWLDGYTVEEEQKYIVVLGKSIYNTTTYGQIGEVNSKKIMQSVYANEESIIAPNQYTKSEILEVKDGESIFKRFAIKVEELEE